MYRDVSLKYRYIEFGPYRLGLHLNGEERQTFHSLRQPDQY